MWKSNRKDECYDVYNDACVECHDKLITTELKTPLNDAIITGTYLDSCLIFCIPFNTK